MVRVNKNRKKSWRKHVDISEVEEFLEDERRAERVGIKKTDPVFVIETKGSSATPGEEDDDAVNIVIKTGPKSTKDIVANLSCYRALRSGSKAEAISRPLLNPPTEQKFPQKQKKSLFKTALKKLTRSDKASSKVFYDIWKPEECKLPQELDELEKGQMRLIGKNKIKYPENLIQKPSLLPAVEIPSAGASYNPSFEDHQALLAKANEVELAELKEETHLRRVVTAHYTRQTPQQINDTWMTEMSQGLGDDEDDDEEVGPPSDDEEPILVSRSTAVSDDRTKSKAKKLREKMQKKMEAERKKAIKDSKKLKNQLVHVKAITKDIKKDEEKSLVRQKKRQERQVEKLYNPRRLCRTKYDAPDIELNLSTEIKGSLRAVKMEGNLLEDRFKSFQRRSLIEPLQLSLKKRSSLKPPIKKVTKRSHRDDPPPETRRRNRKIK